MTVDRRESPEHPLTRKGQATKDRIVAAAAKLIFERGVAGTSIQDVQRAADVSASQLYHYFDDKKKLVRAVIEFQSQAVLDAQEPLLAHLDTVEGLRAWRDLLVRIQIDAGCEGGCPIGTLAGELAEAYPECRIDLSLGFNRWEQAIREGLRAMHARGDLSHDADPDRLAAATLAAVQGGLLLTQVHRNTAALEAAIDEMIDHIASLQSRQTTKHS